MNDPEINYGFVIIKHVNWASNMTADEKNFLKAIADACHADTIAYPSLARLQHYMARSRRTVFRAIDSLVAKGIVTKRDDLCIRGRDNNRYEVHLTALIARCDPRYIEEMERYHQKYINKHADRCHADTDRCHADTQQVSGRHPNVPPNVPSNVQRTSCKGDFQSGEERVGNSGGLISDYMRNEEMAELFGKVEAALQSESPQSQHPRNPELSARSWSKLLKEFHTSTHCYPRPMSIVAVLHGRSPGYAVTKEKYPTTLRELLDSHTITTPVSPPISDNDHHDRQIRDDMRDQLCNRVGGGLLDDIPGMAEVLQEFK